LKVWPRQRWRASRIKLHNLNVQAQAPSRRLCVGRAFVSCYWRLQRPERSPVGHRSLCSGDLECPEDTIYSIPLSHLS
jgi:hypothetical protein